MAFYTLYEFTDENLSGSDAVDQYCSATVQDKFELQSVARVDRPGEAAPALLAAVRNLVRVGTGTQSISSSAWAHLRST